MAITHAGPSVLLAHSNSVALPTPWMNKAQLRSMICIQFGFHRRPDSSFIHYFTRLTAWPRSYLKTVTVEVEQVRNLAQNGRNKEKACLCSTIRALQGRTMPIFSRCGCSFNTLYRLCRQTEVATGTTFHLGWYPLIYDKHYILYRDTTKMSSRLYWGVKWELKYHADWIDRRVY